MAGSGSAAVAGGLARHIPVLAGRAIAWLSVHQGGLFVDATFGAGSYARAILATPAARVIGIDMDDRAIALAAPLIEEAQGRLQLAEDRFSNLETVVANHGAAGVDGVVFDLGMSSVQLDEAGRGFSFRRDGPLDMRMEQSGTSAADLVARAGERDLAAIIASLGEERHARRIARAIVRARAQHPIATTRALAEIVAAAVPTREGAIHPATRTFQALRMFINDELSQLLQGLVAAERVIRPAGRLVVVAFHSLEDRIVKTYLAAHGSASSPSRHYPLIAFEPPTFRILTRRPEKPDVGEIAVNPRARSAKLRAAERTDAPPRPADFDKLLPRLPSLAEILRGRA